MTTTKRIKYTKMDQIQHVLERPDMYVGSTRPQDIDEYVVTGNFMDDNIRIIKKTINYAPALLRIFIEPLSNIIDNVARSRQSGNFVKDIKIDINAEGRITMWNDGDVIPIEINEEEKIYNHSLIFGNLLTSSNYDDTQDRTDISGTNGVGIKAVSIFAREFTVEGADPVHKRSFSQTWKNNMSETSPPIVKKSSKSGFTKVSFIPDFKRFGLEDNFTEDIVSMFKKYIIDTAMLTKCNVYYNDVKVDVPSLSEYAQLYRENRTEEVLCLKTDTCEVVITPSENEEWEAFAFSNGVYNKNGGTHVDSWAETLFRPFVEKLNKPKIPQINIKNIKQCFNLFVVASVKRPRYDSQSKFKLESPVVESEIKKPDLAKMFKWSVMETLHDMIRTKEFSVLKKSERKKGHVTIKGLDPANFEGGKKAMECVLILIEGLSAKTFAVQGIEAGAFGKKGRDYFGIYPLRGKLLNTRCATPKAISDNHVVDDIIKALGLKFDVDYLDDENFKKLRYGSLLLIVDQDVDGFHIAGLIMNLFDSLFPSLMKRSPSFITSMQTPIVKVMLPKNKTITFYDEKEFFTYRDEILKNNPKATINKKYYKGLGSSNNTEVMEAFGKKIVEFVYDDKASLALKKAFLTSQADARKAWIADYNDAEGGLKWNGDAEEMQDFNVSEFIDKELIKFSIADCQRSIPNVIDGLKTSQRKILYGTIEKKVVFNTPVSKLPRVSQLAGAVSELTKYHHGDQNLFDTIIKMAQTFVGSNNISILFPEGQFGTVSNMGEDAASPRYIFTKLDILTRMIFRQEDDDLLKLILDDGTYVEPEIYLPIIPMVLVNGSRGIGTGWSCAVPSYNPLEIIQAVKLWIKYDGKVFFEENDFKSCLLPEMTPWYREWKGLITRKEKTQHTFVSWGVIEKIEGTNKKGKKGTICKVKEVPVGMSIDSFKCFLDELLENKQIISYENHSRPNITDFIIYENPDGVNCSLENLKLYKYIHTSNMVMFDSNNNIKRYESPQHIIDYFCQVRLPYYTTRKQKILAGYNEKIPILQNKFRFISEILEQKISMFVKGKPKKMNDISLELEENKYEKIDGDYDYLLQMPIKSQTEERVEQLKKEVDSLIEKRDILQNTSEKELWLTELDELEKEYPKWADEVRKNDFLSNKPSKKKK